MAFTGRVRWRVEACALVLPAALVRDAPGAEAVTGRPLPLTRTTAARRLPDGPPTLRALRHQPALIDDATAARLLESGAAGALGVDEVRWARAWLICSQAVVAAEPDSGAGERVTPAFDTSRVPVPKGIGSSARQAEILSALVDAGVVVPVHEATRAGADRSPDGHGSAASAPDAPRLLQRVGWAPAVCAPHSAAVELDWPSVVAACGREPATLLVLRTLAEYVLPADAWTGVPRRDFVERSGYQQKQIRTALRRLIAAGIVEAEGENGRTARYRFTGYALAPRWNQTVGMEPVSGSSSHRVSGTSPSSPATLVATEGRNVARQPLEAPHGAELAGLDVVLGGVTVRMAPGASLDVGAGARASIEVGADGRLALRVQPG